MTSRDTSPVGAYPAPPGITPNFANPESIANQVIIAAIACPAFAIPIVLSRLYTSHFILRRWHLDDTLIFIGLLFAIGYSIQSAQASSTGMGRHIWDVRLDDFLLFLKLGAIVGNPLFNLATLFTKASILFFYLRFPASQAFRLTVYTVMFLGCGNSFNSAISPLYVCRPMSRYWDPSVSGSCIDGSMLFLTSSVINAATDVILLLLPIWMLWRLRLSLLKKIGVLCIMMTGGFVCVISILRTAWIPSSLNDPDITWRWTINLVLCLVELYAGIICACLPCVKALVKRCCLKLSPGKARATGPFHSYQRRYAANHRNIDSSYDSELPISEVPRETPTTVTTSRD